MKTIARIRSDFPEKFGIPRQSGLADMLTATVVFEPAYRNPDALRGIEAFSHLWLLWNFSETEREEWSPTVRPPRLGGNTRVGVFATRSPFRPNPIGLSSVRLLRVQLHTPDGPQLSVGGADLMDGTPIYDIKPYLPFTDCHPDAVGGFADAVREKCLIVKLPDALPAHFTEKTGEALCAILAQDPRPSYQDDPLRVYRFTYGGWNVAFRVANGEAIVTEILPHTR